MNVAIVYQLNGVDTYLFIVNDISQTDIDVLEKANGTCLNTDSATLETEMILAAIDGANNHFDDVDDSWHGKWTHHRHDFPGTNLNVDKIYLIGWY